MKGDTEEKHFYGCFKDFKVLKIPYHGGQDNRQFSMYVFLPNMKDGLITRSNSEVQFHPKVII